MSFGNVGPTGNLTARGPRRARAIRIPGIGRILLTRDPGSSFRLASEAFQTHLHAHHLDAHGQLKGSHALGSGLVTHAGVWLLAQDTAVTAGTAALAACKYHGSGTGTTSATALDTQLQTAIGTTATAGVNSNADASPNATVQSVATITYAAAAAVTEWGLFNQAALSGATMWDHKVFAAINVLGGDSIIFTYTLTLASGG